MEGRGYWILGNPDGIIMYVGADAETAHHRMTQTPSRQQLYTAPGPACEGHESDDVPVELRLHSSAVVANFSLKNGRAMPSISKLWGPLVDLVIWPVDQSGGSMIP